jgi:hypothetical protein
MRIDKKAVERDSSIITTEEKRDHALYFVEDGEQGFSPERNRATIEASIAKYEANRLKKQTTYVEEIRYRADAVATYLKSRWAEGSTPIEKYFGKSELAKLRGERIMNTIRNKSGRKIYLPE